MTICSVNIGSSGGGATGATCVSYANCDLGCCTKSYGGCAGPDLRNCSLHGGDKTACEGDPCCFWAAPPEPCRDRACPTLSEALCVSCGCTKDGTCIKIACESLAGTSKNPDVCAGCDTCAGDWLVDNARDLPWTVYVRTLSFAYTGTPSVAKASAYDLVIG